MKDFTAAINNSLEALFKSEELSKKNSLLDKGKIVYLQIRLFKIPRIARPRRKFLRLKHSLHGDDPEICLFVPNRKSGVEYKMTTDELIDSVVEYYTDLLEKHKVKGITTIMPLKQLRCEYGTYELRRKLVQRFDLFLCKNSLLYNERFLTGLGKFFTFSLKEPLGISFPKPDSNYDPEFQKNVERAIYTSSFYIKPCSDNYTVPIGTLAHTKEQLRENLGTVMEQLVAEDFIPGGFDNVRIIYLWPSQGKTIPFYIQTELPNLKKSIHLKPRRKLEKAVRGTISTQPTKEVVVTPFGDVFVTDLKRKRKRKQDDDDDDDDFETDDDEPFDDGSEEEEDENRRESKEKKKPKQNSDEESGSESEDDKDIEEAERRLFFARQ